MAARGLASPVPATVVRRVVRRVLAGERVGPAVMSVTFLSSQRMRAANRRALGRDRATDVLAFGMVHGGLQVGDIYVCPPVARRSAGRYGVPVREEVTRLLVHGTLHALGWDHPSGTTRTRSAMWRRQEGYVRAALGEGAR